MVRQQVAWMIVLVLGILVPTVVAQPPTSGWKIVGYYPSWGTYAANYQVSRIPAQNLTHVVYAFANISAGGELVLGDAFADVQKRFPGDGDGTSFQGGFRQLLQLKKRNPHLKTLLAVGGWSWSGRFSDVALTVASRQKFSRSCVALVARYGFDGLDIDWEYPVEGGRAGNRKRPVDKSNYTLLVAELRKQFDARGRQDRRRYLITAATSAAAAHYRHIELGKVSALLDWFNLMAYDFAGPWSSRTGFHAGLAATGAPGEDSQLNVMAAVKGYLKAGVPARKIVLGVPFYGRGWTGVAPADHGLFATYQGIPRGTREGGIYEYRDLVKTQVRPAIRHWHAQAQVPWLYDPATRTMISYEDVESVSAKVKYVRSQKLGGMMAWDLSKDAEGSQSLLQAMRRGLPRQKK